VSRRVLKASGRLKSGQWQSKAGSAAPRETIDTPLGARTSGRAASSKQARKIKNFTGFDAHQESPTTPGVHLHTIGHSPQELAERVLAALI
jgi:hypothetical protein